jgi:hypothetical protein
MGAAFGFANAHEVIAIVHSMGRRCSSHRGLQLSHIPNYLADTLVAEAADLVPAGRSSAVERFFPYRGKEDVGLVVVSDSRSRQFDNAPDFRIRIPRDLGSVSWNTHGDDS